MATGLELVGDFFGVFVARVVFGNDTEVAVSAGDFAPFGPGRLVAATSTTEEGDNAAVVILDTVEDLLEGVGGMGEVDDDVERLASVDAVHATFDLVESVEAVFDLVVGKTEFAADGDGGERVVDVELTGDFGLDFDSRISFGAGFVFDSVGV